jgi:hypothetical protein
VSTFDVRTDAGSEVLASVGLGYRRRIGARWRLEALARYNHHFADWELEDQVSGATGSVGDYGTTSLLVGFSFR